MNSVSLLLSLSVQYLLPLLICSVTFYAIHKSSHLSLRVSFGARLLASLLLSFSIYPILSTILFRVNDPLVLATSGSAFTFDTTATPSSTNSTFKTSLDLYLSLSFPSSSLHSTTESHDNDLDLLSLALEHLLNGAHSLIALLLVILSNWSFLFYANFMFGLFVWIHSLIAISSINTAITSNSVQSLYILFSTTALLISQLFTISFLWIKSFSLMFIGLKEFVEELWFRICVFYVFQHFTLIVAIKLFSYFTTPFHKRSKFVLDSSLIEIQPIILSTSIPIGTIYNSLCLFGCLFSMFIYQSPSILVFIQCVLFLLLVEPPNFINSTIPSSSQVPFSQKSVSVIDIITNMHLAPGPFIFPNSTFSHTNMTLSASTSASTFAPSPSTPSTSASSLPPLPPQNFKQKVEIWKTHPYLILGCLFIVVKMWWDEISINYSQNRWSGLINAHYITLEGLVVLSCVLFHYYICSKLLFVLKWAGNGGLGFILIPDLLWRRQSIDSSGSFNNNNINNNIINSNCMKMTPLTTSTTTTTTTAVTGNNKASGLEFDDNLNQADESDDDDNNNNNDDDNDSNNDNKNYPNSRNASKTRNIVMLNGKTYTTRNQNINMITKRRHVKLQSSVTGAKQLDNKNESSSHSSVTTSNSSSSKSSKNIFYSLNERLAAKLYVFISISMSSLNFWQSVSLGVSSTLLIAALIYNERWSLVVSVVSTLYHYALLRAIQWHQRNYRGLEL